jgi:PAS domain S-box-containing protein
VTDELTSISLENSIEYYEDKTNSITLEDMLSEPDFKFHSIESKTNLGFRKSTIWIRFKLQNKKKLVRHPITVLKANSPEIDYIDFYQISENGNIVNSVKTGIMRSVETRQRLDENFLFLISVPQNQTHIIYIRIKSETPLSLSYSLSSMDQYLKENHWKTLFLGIYIGIFLLAIGYYSILYYRLRDRSFLFLVLTGFILLCDLLASRQFASIYLWPDFIFWNKISVLIFDALLLIFFIFFVIEFLELKKYLQSWIRILYAIAYVMISLVILTPILDLFITKQIIYILILIALAAIILVSYLAVHKGYSPAKYFLVGVLFICPAGIYHLLVEFSLFPAGKIGSNGYIIASIFLILFFSQAVSDRINLFKTQKEKAEKDLLKSEEHLKLILKGANLGTWDWDIKNNIIYRNQRWFEILGIKSNEIKSDIETWRDLIHKDDRKRVDKQLEAHLRDKTGFFEAEYRIKHKSGKWIWILDRGGIIEYDNDENPIRITGTMVDITKRKRAEISQQIIYNITNAVSITKDMYTFYQTIHTELNKLIDAKNFQVGIYDESRHIITLPYSVDQKDDYKEIPAGRSCSAYVIRKKQAVLIKEKDIDILLAKGEIEIFGTRSKVWLGVPLKVDEKVIGLIFVQSYENENAYNEDDRALLEFVSDQIAISIKRKQSEQAIRESEEKFRLYVENAHDGVMIVGDNFKFEYANNELSRILGYPLEEIVGKEFTKFLHNDSISIVTDHYFRRRKGENVPNRYEFSIVTKSGDIRDVEISSSVLKDSKGQIKTIAHLLDITEQKRAQSALIESENRFKTLFNSAGDAYFIMKEDIITECNQKTLEMFNCKRNQIIGKTPYDFSPQKQLDGQLSSKKGSEKINKVLAGKPQFFEWKHITLDGKPFFAEVNLNTIQLHKELYIQAIVRDISARKRSEYLLHVLNEAGMAMQNALTTSEIFKRISKTLHKYGYHFTYFTYNEQEDSLYPAFVSYSEKILNEIKKHSKQKFRDIKVKKESIKELSEVIDERNTIFRKKGQDLISKIIPSLSNLTNQKISKILYIPALIVAPTIANDKVKGVISIQSDELVESDVSAISVFVHQFTSALNRAEHFEQTQKEIAIRLEAEKALKNSEEYFRSIIENSKDVVLIIDETGKITYESPSHKRVLGFSQENYESKNIFMHLHLEDLPNIEKQLNEIKKKPGQTETINCRFQHFDGSWRYIEGTLTNLLYMSSVRGIVFNYRDITESQHLQEQLNQAQKMEAIGQLAGGVAHDFNNLLTVISGYSHLLLADPDLGKNYKDRLEEIRRASDRAETLTRQLLAFSRKEIVQPIIIDINTVINNSIKMLKRLIGEDIYIKLNLAIELPNIMADPHQLEQVLINLMVNARDAIQAHAKVSKKKRIIIETKYIYLDKAYLEAYSGLREGGHIQLSISDTGIGMDKQTIDKIFEPFYTTKEQSKGTGLGLSTVYGIVKQNQASINVYSELGKGTTFKIYWPVKETKTKSTVAKVKPELKKGNEIILLVEDDQGVRTFIDQALTSLGYLVYQAKNGEEALLLLEKEKVKPHLLITDIIMPGMDGKELSLKVKNILPKVKVIFTSGYTDSYIGSEELKKEGVHFIGKPYSISTISSKIREVLTQS